VNDFELNEQQRTGRTRTNNGVTAKTTITNAVLVLFVLFVQFVVVRVIIVPSVSVWNVSEADQQRELPWRESDPLSGFAGAPLAAG